MYAPVVTWQTVHFFLILSVILSWYSQQLDFVMAYPQAHAQVPLYMKIPQGYHCLWISRCSHALKLLCNMYGQKQAHCVWNQYLDEGMIQAGFNPGKWDPCLYYQKSVIILMYIDDS